MASNTNMIQLLQMTILPLSLCLVALLSVGDANQATNLNRLINSKRTLQNQPGFSHFGVGNDLNAPQTVYIGPQDGLMEADKIDSLPGQPDAVDFDQYSGYVTIDPKAGKALFYYFVESPQNASSNPLVLWLNGGPGCSSIGGGAMSEQGPFRVNSDGKTLFRNNYSWNNVANVIFLESPAGVGFSYSNRSSDYDHTGDNSTAIDAYTFVVNWLERFPQYKTRDFYIAGESYAGHYVPQLAYTILLNNNSTNQTVVNLKGIMMGNPVIHDPTDTKGLFDHLWTHALVSDETHDGIIANCDFSSANLSTQCEIFMVQSLIEIGNIDIYNIYAPLCHNTSLKNDTTGSVEYVDPCFDVYVDAYLNTAKVQKALHARPTVWNDCRHYNWTDSPNTVLPIIENLISNGLRVWIYSGDVDARVSVTGTRYSINALRIPVKSVWRPWMLNKEVGGYVVRYHNGLTFVTVRGAGHLVPTDQPKRALTLISSFLKGTLPPST